MSAQPAVPQPSQQPRIPIYPGTPVVADPDLRAGDSGICVVADDVWDLSPFAGKSTMASTNVRFDSFPEQFRDAAKRIVWCLLNLETPVDELDRYAATRTRVSAGTVRTIVGTALRPFFCWLDERAVGDLASVDDHTLEEYSRYITAQSVTRAVKQQRLFGVTRVWLLAPYLPEEDRLIQPPWEREGLDELLGPADWSAENKTLPVHPQTMSPLLVWAVRFVEDLADDVLRASAERERLDNRIGSVTGAEATRRIREFFDEHVRTGKPLPASITRGERLGFASSYVAGSLGVPLGSLAPRRPEGLSVVAGTPLDLPVTGTVDGVPWVDELHYHDVPHLRRMLLGACLIVVAYLSGMRGEEVRALGRGCCESVPTEAGQPDGYVIIARSFKDALDSGGNAIRGGKVREQPWHVVSTVAAAINVMERLHGDDFIFAVQPFSGRREDQEKVISAPYANRLIADFIEYTNGLAARLDRDHEGIPDDPEGKVTLQRFRRTLAWFIYRLPAGRIALGLQYGHLRGYTSDGYASRASTGLRDVFPIEEAYSIADTLSDAADRLEAGEQVSGPAADRFIAGVGEYATYYQGQYLTPKQAAKLRRNPALRIYDNGEQMLACCYDATKALCHPENQRTPDLATTPDLTRCVPGCANGARTDGHVERLKEQQRWHEEQAAASATPEPLRERHLQRVASLQQIVDDHEATRQAAKPGGEDDR